MEGQQTQAPAEPYWNWFRRMCLLWAIIIAAGFAGTEINIENPDRINLFWGVLTIVGLAYMKKFMPFSDAALKKIFLAWFWILAVGIALSVFSFRVPPLYPLAGNLGIFWLALMAAGHAATGWLDKKPIYITTTGMQILAASLAFFVPSLFALQYVLAGAVGALAMLWLLLYA